MSKQRIYVEKKQNFRTEAIELMNDFNTNLKLNMNSMRLLNIYDVFNISSELLKKAKATVFAEQVTDSIEEEISLEDTKYLAVEFLPGQFDQRADSAWQCIKLIDASANPIIRSAKLIIFDETVNEKDVDRIKEYYINKVESREKDLSVLSSAEDVHIEPVPVFEKFNTLSEQELYDFKQELGLAMSDQDILHIQNYFKKQEKRNPNETEILMLDTYWSDHCRHTTFETILSDITFASDRFSEQFQEVFEMYLNLRDEVHGSKKPMTLMDMATIVGKYERKVGNLDDMEVSDEINACSVFVNVDVNGVDEKWLLMFKNETHNHPTEIEPFGGASTCVGGAIRDPLSGRSFVYQAMRVTGAMNPLEEINETIDGKLPQRKISIGATHGYSSYGNQIGLATTHVREIYHPGYQAKHMEVGAVVGAVPASYVRREKPQVGDVVIMFGGKTGRDGVGGASGSSKEHTEASLTTSSAEVQKGNAPEERKIQRLFRNPEVTRLVKKSNDFGAGGVSVAVGEIADSLEIYLDNVSVKYKGLNGTELAISESQERMAVLVEKEDVDRFIALCNKENLEAYEVARVTDDNRLVMYWRGQKLVDLSREFIDTNGVRQSSTIEMPRLNENLPFKRFIKGNNLRDKIINNLQDKNVAMQKGMIEHFDATVGASTVLMPFGGKNQTSETQASVQKLPVLNGETSTASIMTYGYNPFISEWSPFHGASYAIVESLAKVVSCGASIDKVRFSFQEYFEKLGTDPKKWAKPFSALLGAIYVQKGFDLPAIGGKDSMSGTFKDINVPPTLISFAVTTEKVKHIVSTDLKSAGNNLYIIKHQAYDTSLPNIEQLKTNFKFINDLNKNGNIASMFAIENGGISEALAKMSLGNEIGLDVNTELNLFDYDYGSIIIETSQTLDFENAILLGQTMTGDVTINGESFTHHELLHVLTETFEPLFKTHVDLDKTMVTSSECELEYDKVKHHLDVVKVLIPVFPGMNSEYDMTKAFERAGGKVTQLVFRNRTEQDINNSINELVNEINASQVMAISGGFSAGDEPDGSGKFIANILNNQEVKDAIQSFLKRDGLLLGICNGFQALIKSGLLPYGEFGQEQNSPTLFKNNINRHISHITTTKVSTKKSPWLSSFDLGEVHKVAVSHGEGKFVCSDDIAKELFENGQVAFQYTNLEGIPTNNGQYNPNGSTMAIEGVISPCGRILGKMGHSERFSEGCFKNIYGNKNQDIFKNAINYFKGGIN